MSGGHGALGARAPGVGGCVDRFAGGEAGHALAAGRINLLGERGGIVAPATREEHQ